VPGGTIDAHTIGAILTGLGPAAVALNGPPSHTFTGTPALLPHTASNHEPPYYTLAFIIKL
jgi:hypothetical protein